jgi:hypothetical protein
MANELRILDRPWNEAQAGDVLAITDRYGELILALRTRAEACGFSYAQLDKRAGLPTGYSAKLFGPSHAKNLGPVSLNALLKALGLKLAIVADEAPVPARPKTRHQDRHPLDSPHLPRREHQIPA